MTKAELKKETIKKVLKTLVEEFNIYNIERENQYFDFWVDYKDHTLQMQMDTRGYDIGSWDSTKLGGSGWTEEQIAKQKAAVELEDKMNERVREIVAS